MRNQFFADRKDVYKWSLLLDEAGPSSHILYLAMLRPDTPNGHGRDYGEPTVQEYTREDVIQFFEQERAGGIKDLSRITRLSPSRIHVVLDQYDHRAREGYFRKALSVSRDRKPSEKFVVFLDPDNGIAGKRPKSLHVCASELRDTWDSLREGDKLVVYQHQFRDSEWIGLRKGALGQAIGVEEEKIQEKKCQSVCFFVVHKQMMG